MLSHGVKEFEPLCRYLRMRDFGLKLFSPSQIIQTHRLYHEQVFDFSFHQAKLALLLQEYKHQKFEPLREFLESIALDCPHAYFRRGVRASKQKLNFDFTQVKIVRKTNFATRLAELALQAVSNPYERHRFLQNFMLSNDSVTVAVEVPVYLTEEDLEHLKCELGFEIPFNWEEERAEDGRWILTGHIDILQIRNGMIRILDYKPQARKQKPLTQLVFYALALSRLTTLRVYELKCAWFDDRDYFEFFPLHVVYKLGRGKRKEDIRQMKLKMEEKGGRFV